MDTEETKQCSNCKRDIPASKFELHETHCQRHMTVCEECEEVVPKQRLEEHKTEFHAPIPCDLCGVTVAKHDLEDHKDSTCREAQIECKYCELEIKRKDFQEHVTQCGSRTDFCELCNQRVMLRDMSEHKETKCGHLRAESPLAESDVREIMERERDHIPQQRDVSVDPLWLQTVAQACGEDTLDDVLAQNMFYEDFRNVSGHNPDIPYSHLGNHGNDVMPQTASERVRDDRAVAQQVQEDESDQRSYEFARQLHERERAYVAQLQRDEDLARRLQEQQQTYQPGQSYNTYGLPSEEELPRPKPPSVYQSGSGDEQRSFQVAKDMQEREHAYQAQLERDADLARQLQNQESTKQGYSGQSYQPGFSGQDYQPSYSGQAYQSVHTGHSSSYNSYGLPDDEQPRPKTPPSSSSNSQDDMGKIPCQWCNKLFPFEQIQQHQMSCYADMDSTPAQTQSSYKDVHQPHPKTPPSEDRNDLVPCQWCSKLFPFEKIIQHENECNPQYFTHKCQKCGNFHSHTTSGYTAPRYATTSQTSDYNPREIRMTQQVIDRVCSEDRNEGLAREKSLSHCKFCGDSMEQSLVYIHEQICHKNPEKDLKNAFTKFGTQSSLQTKKQTNETEDTAKIPCEFCEEPVPLSILIRHQQKCPKNPDRYPFSTTSSHFTITPSVNEEESVGNMETDDAKVPCEHCGELIPIANFIKHEARCLVRQRMQSTRPAIKPTAPKTSSSSSQTAPTQPKSLDKPLATNETRRNKLAIKFPSEQDKTGQQNSVKSKPHLNHTQPSNRAPSDTTGFTSPSTSGYSSLTSSRANPNSHSSLNRYSSLPAGGHLQRQPLDSSSLHTQPDVRRQHSQPLPSLSVQGRQLLPPQHTNGSSSSTHTKPTRVGVHNPGT